MRIISPHQKIELDGPWDVGDWAAQLEVSPRELLNAINAVGPILCDVEAHLREIREPVGDYVDRMRSRLDEIEIQFERLAEERKGIVAFLEGFAHLQRSQRASQSSAALIPMSKEPSDTELASFQRALEEGLKLGSRVNSGASSSASVVDAVHRLLLDGRRRSIHEILAFLEIREVPLKGVNPSAFLSTLLSRDRRFDANRRDGWGLA